MTTHKMKLAREPFEKILNGEKIIESRLFDEKRQLIMIGDEIEFLQSDDSAKIIKTKVKKIYRHCSFKDLFSCFPADYFGGESTDELLEEINKFYSKEDQSKYGVVGIKIEIHK